jgi:hypothetical protein
MADDRIQLITHQGKQILTVDLSHCSAVRVEKILREVPEVVSTYPLGSVLVFCDLTGASFNREAVLAMKEAAVFDKPTSRDPHGWEQRAFPRSILRV